MTRKLDVPFFLDSWATSAGVIAGGLGVGVAGGVLYNLVMAATIWNSRAWIWMASSGLVAWSTWFFRRAGWIDIERPFRLVGAGMLTGLANACLVSAILHFVIGIAEDPNTRAFRTALGAVIGDARASLLVEEIAIEIADKTISLITAAAVIVLLLERSPSGSARHA